MTQNIASGLAVATGASVTLLAGPVAGHPQFVVSVSSAVASAVEIYTHPLSAPDHGAHRGTYYPFATQVAIATAAIAPGARSVLIPAVPGRTFRQVGVTIRNGDVKAIAAHVDLFTEGPGDA